MCLHKLHKMTPKQKKIRFDVLAFKAFNIAVDQSTPRPVACLSTPIFWVGARYHQGRIYLDKNVEELLACSSSRKRPHEYSTGFHMYANATPAEVRYPVLFGDVTAVGTQDGEKVYVARAMYILTGSEHYDWFHHPEDRIHLTRLVRNLYKDALLLQRLQSKKHK